MQRRAKKTLWTKDLRLKPLHKVSGKMILSNYRRGYAGVRALPPEAMKFVLPNGKQIPDDMTLGELLDLWTGIGEDAG
jgi:hypothetical protein